MTEEIKAIETAGLVLNQIAKALFLLTNKRITLAEKAIKAELYECAKAENQLIAKLLAVVSAEAGSFDNNDFREITEVNIAIANELKTFMDAANYDLNYLEQYFEHDFWLRLDNHKFSYKLSEFNRKLSCLAEGPEFA